MAPFFYTSFLDFNNISTAMAVQSCKECGASHHYEIRFWEDLPAPSSTLGMNHSFPVSLVSYFLSPDEVLAFAATVAVDPPPSPSSS